MYDNLPALELLESTHQFPGVFTFKVIGTVESGFAARVLAAVREELEFDEDPPNHSRYTANGKHVAVTVEPYVESSYEVLAVYRRLHQLTGVVMFL